MQDAYALEIAAGKRSPTLLLLEHPHVYTFGRKGNAENLLWDEGLLKEKGIATHWVDRGGDITYHGPGQLVGYPLLPLGKISADEKIPKADYVGYIRKIENMLIATLMRFGIAAGQRAGKTGVWVQADVHSRCVRCKPEDKKQPAKIAAIGVKVDANGVSRHGFALNVNPDMEYWEGIIPCGINEPVASLEDLLYPFPEMSKVKEVLSGEFLRSFS
jgi:lipoate-protein ligase B